MLLIKYFLSICDLWQIILEYKTNLASFKEKNSNKYQQQQKHKHIPVFACMDG